MAEPTAPPIAEGGSKAASNIGAGLGRKIGPLPLWAWILGVGGLGIVGYLIYQSVNNANNASAGAIGSLLPGAAGGGGGTTTTTPAAISNQTWVATTAAAVAASLGLPINQVTTLLQDFLAGTPPVGSGQASTEYENIVNSALQLGGQPPTAPGTAPSGTNPYGTQAGWLAAILQFLPTTLTQQQITDITNVINGTANTLTQDEANALNLAEGIIGLGPVIPNYTIGAAPAAPGSLTQTLINTWNNLYLALPTSGQTFQAWLALAPTAITTGVSTTNLQTIFTYFNTKAGQAAVAAAGGPLNWWNNYLANPSGTPITVPPTTGGGTTVITGGTTGH